MPNDNEEPKYPIDLAKSPKDLGMPVNMKDEMPDKIYPTLYLEWTQPYNFPDSGTMTVEFKKKSEENRKTKGETMQRVELDITKILDTEAGEGEEAEEASTSEMLDKEVAKKASKKKKVMDTEDEESY